MAKVEKLPASTENSSLGFVDVAVGNFLQNPHCEHGPTVLFKRHLNNGEIKQFYACSAYRDRKFCSFYIKVDEERPLSLDLEDSSAKEAEMFNLHCQKYDKFHNNLESDIRFCISCSDLVLKAEFAKHSTCSQFQHLSKEEVRLPTQILWPKSHPKCEAQYFFTDKSLQVLVEALQRLRFEKLLCIGAPRLHESVRSRSDLNISSLLLDIDDRFCHFFPVEEFLVYNLFTHYFFGGARSKEIYLKLLTGSEKILLFMDPPFGGRMELISNTLRIIEREWREANDLVSDEVLPVIFIFPYFSEKSVKSRFPSLVMLEYQLDYDNHPIYTTGPKGMKRGSPVRMFTNLAPHLFPFPEDEGYSLCSACDRWVHSRNAHCVKCGDCTSKDGRTYKHCDDCGLCVKPMWIHCLTCSQCLPKDHRCKKTHQKTKRRATRRRARKISAPALISKRKLQDKSRSKAKKRKTPLPQNLKEEKERNLSILKKVFEKN